MRYKFLHSPDVSKSGPSQRIQASEDLERRFGSVPITTFTRFETVQALRFETWRYNNNKTQGYPASLTDPALNLFLAEIGTLFTIARIDWESVIAEAERMTRTTSAKGWRTADLVHVACAVSSHSVEFYSFDHNQNLLAASEGMKTPLAEFVGQ